MNEAQTRAEHIEPALRAAGWGVVEGSRIAREYRITAGRKEGPGRRASAEIADFVLWYRNHRLAVVEAKAWGGQNGRTSTSSRLDHFRKGSPVWRHDSPIAPDIRSTVTASNP